MAYACYWHSPLALIQIERCQIYNYMQWSTTTEPAAPGYGVGFTRGKDSKPGLHVSQTHSGVSTRLRSVYAAPGDQGCFKVARVLHAHGGQAGSILN